MRGRTPSRTRSASIATSSWYPPFGAWICGLDSRAPWHGGAADHRLSPLRRRANRSLESTSVRHKTSPAPHLAAASIVDVLVPVALDQSYSYRVPAGVDLKPGDLVSVPLGAREATGVVWADQVEVRPGLHNRLKDVSEKLDLPPLKDELRHFVDWCANYTLASRGMVLRMALRMGDSLGPERVRVGVRLAGRPPARMTAARARVLRLLADGLVRPKGDAAREAGVSAGVIDGLVDEGALETLALPPEPVARPPDPSYAVPDFSAAQRAAADA